MENQAKYGRNGDSQLVHMRPDELQGLHMLARATGTNLTRNPTTGHMEAFSLGKWLLPALAIGLTAGTAAPALLGTNAVSGAGLLGNGLGFMGSTVPVGGGVLGGAANAFGTAKEMFGPAKDVLGAANTANSLFGQESEQPIQASPFMQNQGPNPGPQGLREMAQMDNAQSMQQNQMSEEEKMKRARQIAMMRGMYGTA